MKPLSYIAIHITMAGILFGSLAEPVNALEVDREVAPRITVGGRVVSTLDSVNLDSEPEEKDNINLADSTILMRFDKRMFSKGVAGANVGFKEGGEGDKADVRMHELHAFYWNEDYSTALGRTRLRNTVVEFPLLRDDDFLTYTHVGNASSNEEYDQIYANQFSFDWHVDKKIQKLGLWAGTRINEAGKTAPEGFDTVGMGYVYEQSEDMLYVKKLRHAGLLVDRQKVTTSTGDEWMTAVVAGAEFNLNRNPTKNWSMATQVLFNQGVDGVTLSDVAVGASDAIASRAAAKSNALVASIRYTARPHLLTRYQAAINIAYKDYSDLNDAAQWSIAPTVVYRIGQGVDLLGQAKYTDYSAGLGDGSDTVVQLGIAFSLETMFNDNIGERNSILNLEHGYIN